MNAQFYIDALEADFELENIAYDADGYIIFDIISVMIGEDGDIITPEEYAEIAGQCPYEIEELKDKAAAFFDAECGAEPVYF